MQSGDILNAYLNQWCIIATGFISGNSLSEVRKDARDFVKKWGPTEFSVAQPNLLHVHVCALIEGLDVLQTEQVDGLPGLNEVLRNTKKSNDATVLLNHKACLTHRAFLFRRLDESEMEGCISDIIYAKNMTLRPMLLFVIFVEALSFFELARQSAKLSRSSQTTQKWLSKGDFLLKKIQLWSKQVWNFENKVKGTTLRLDYSPLASDC